ncbi:hypothetical protein WME90_35215 [Sorangium sp. So ce375]|uniref:hypothetical protein n=1 Tax=Sorangium sp. So ce375 TaxID=3133306 RepID=UPI003F5C93CF
MSPPQVGVLALTALRRFEDKDDRSTRRRIALVLGEESAGVADIMKALEALGAVVSDMDYERRLDDKRRVNVTLDARIPNTIGVETLIDQLAKQPGVRRVHVRAPT